MFYLKQERKSRFFAAPASCKELHVQVVEI